MSSQDGGFKTDLVLVYIHSWEKKIVYWVSPFFLFLFQGLCISHVIFFKGTNLVIALYIVLTNLGTQLTLLCNNGAELLLSCRNIKRELQIPWYQEATVLEVEAGSGKQRQGLWQVLQSRGNQTCWVKKARP